MLLKSLERLETSSISIKPRMLTADAHSLPFPSESFDTVVSTFTLESVYDHDQVIKEMARVCNSKGKILLMSRGQSYLSIINQWL